MLFAGLCEIPDGLSILSKLEVLKLDNCKGIKSIPACLRHLKSLRELSLNDTNGFSYMDSIRILKIDRLNLRCAIYTCHDTFLHLLLLSEVPQQKLACQLLTLFALSLGSVAPLHSSR